MTQRQPQNIRKRTAPDSYLLRMLNDEPAFLQTPGILAQRVEDLEHVHADRSMWHLLPIC